MQPTKVTLYDTTLRDGTQGEGVSLSCDDKLRIARRLDEFGMAYIEGGWPGSNPKDIEFFDRAQTELSLKHARLTAFGSTCKAGVDPAEDEQVQLLIRANTPAVTIFGKTWDLHVTEVLRTTLDENLRMIRETVRFLKRHGKEVIYDAEHFFDGYRANPEYALSTLKAAIIGGADSVVLCDTNGGSLPWQVGEAVDTVFQEVLGQESHLAPRPPQLAHITVGMHAHNDSETGVANTLEAVRHGCTQVQGTVNGYGERVGNANLCTVLPDLQLKWGYEVLGPGALARLTELSRYVAETANMAHDPRLPYVGSAAFTHKGGTHVTAIMRVEESYQHIDPGLVGNQKRVVVSELSGQGNIRYKAEEFGLNVNGHPGVKQVLQRVKELENQGFSFEGAEASVELMLRRTEPGYVAPFELVDFTVVVEHRESRGIQAQALVKVKVGGETMLTAAEGNGPVNALDAALRKALLPHFPSLDEMRLTDYKVRILDSHAATGATTRVLLDSTNGERVWTTVGASTNIIDASWQALADSFEYALVCAQQPVLA